MFFTVLTSACHPSLSWANSIQSPRPTRTWWLQYRKLHVMFKVSPACLQAFIDTPNRVLEDRVQYSKVNIPNVFCDGHIQIINWVGIVRKPWGFKRTSGVPRNFVRVGGGVQQIHLRTEGRQNGDLGGGSPPSQGFSSICNWLKSVFLLLRMEFPRNWESDSALSNLRNFGLRGFGPPNPLHYTTASHREFWSPCSSISLIKSLRCILTECVN
jgi:hypothetical protein